MAKSVPLYKRIKERIRADLVEVQADSVVARLPAERELQARYGVSRPTISKALTELAAEGLLLKAPGSGSFILRMQDSSPAVFADSPRRIGYVAPIPGHELTRRGLRGIEQAALRRDYRVILSNAGNCVADEHASVRELIASGVRGLVIGPITRTHEELADDYLCHAALEVPVVLIDTVLPEHRHPQVLFDNWRAAYEMTRWLFERGHRRIARLSYLEQWRHATLAPRLQGYQDALRDFGITPDPVLVRRHHPDPQRWADELRAILDEWMSLPEPPTAIIAPEDTGAIEVIDQLIRRGVQVPGDVQVMGWDNREIARRFQPAFPSTNPDFERMGEIACHLLLRAIETGGSTPVVYVLGVPLLTDRRPNAVTAQVGRSVASSQ